LAAKKGRGERKKRLLSGEKRVEKYSRSYLARYTAGKSIRREDSQKKESQVKKWGRGRT